MLDIDKDVLTSVKEIAAERGCTTSRVVSDILRSALPPKRRSFRKVHAVPVLPKRKGAGPVTMQIVNRLRDDY